MTDPEPPTPSGPEALAYDLPPEVLADQDREPDRHTGCRARMRRVRDAARALRAEPLPLIGQLVPALLFLGLLGCVAASTHTTGPLRALWVVAGGWFLTAMGVIAHDCVHRSLSRTGWWNELVGRWVLAQNFASFAAYRALHLGHHTHTGFDADPSGDSPKVQATTNLFIHLLLILVPFGFPLFQIVPGWLAALGVDPVTYPPRVQRAIRRELPGMVLYQLGFFLMLGAEAYPWYLASWLVSMLMIIQLFGFNHVGTEFYTDCVLCNTRNIHARPRPMEGLTLYAGYHVEHHLLPPVPWYRLPRLHRLLQAEGGATFSVDGYGRAQVEMIRGYWRQLLGGERFAGAARKGSGDDPGGPGQG